jgi:hypothetical protein
MHAEEKLVKEFHITCGAMPKLVFIVRADSPEKAAKKLTTDLRAAIAELQKTKGQNKINQSPTA